MQSNLKSLTAQQNSRSVSLHLHWVSNWTANMNMVTPTSAGHTHTCRSHPHLRCSTNTHYAWSHPQAMATPTLLYPHNTHYIWSHPQATPTPVLLYPNTHYIWPYPQATPTPGLLHPNTHYVLRNFSGCHREIKLHWTGQSLAVL